MIPFRLVLALTLLPMAAVVHSAEKPGLRAGAAAADITPKEFPLNMPGAFSANMAGSAHDPLHACALVLDDGATALAMVVEDNLGAQHYAQSTVAAGERAEETNTVKIQAIRIGNLAVCGIPFETIVETGLDLKKRSLFPQTIVISLANGRHGYLPTPGQHRLGGCESWLGTNVVQEDASVILTDNLLEMLAKLKKAE